MRLKRFILESDWEDRLIAVEDWLAKWVAWPIIVFAAAYFGLVAYSVLWR